MKGGPELVALAVIHYPVLNKDGEVVTTSITNFDLHDISRVVCTYGLDRFFVINPIESQRWLARRIIDYWQKGPGAAFNETRSVAFENTTLCSSLEELPRQLGTDRQKLIYTATSAKQQGNTVRYDQMREQFCRGGRYVLLFGTGWGLTREVLQAVDQVLPPIEGGTEYNHLSVRSAVAVTVDRLFGMRVEGTQ